MFGMFDRWVCMDGRCSIVDRDGRFGIFGSVCSAGRVSMFGRTGLAYLDAWEDSNGPVIFNSAVSKNNVGHQIEWETNLWQFGNKYSRDCGWPRRP